MRPSRRIPLLAVAVGLGIWVVDAALDTLFFYDGTFLALLVTDVPAHELYVRVLILVVFVIFGLVVGRQTARVREREHEASLFRRLVDEATDSVFVIDPETGAIEDVNESACAELGYDRSALIGRSVAAVNAEFDDPAAFKGFIDTPEHQTLEYYETTHERADGTTFPVEISASDVTIDGRAYRIAIVRDVTERRERERRLTAYRQAVESSQDLLTAIDADWRFRFVNEAYRAFHGIEREGVEDETLDTVLTDAEFETVEPYLQDALAGERVEFEMTRTRASGDERVLDVWYVPLEDDEGQIHGVAASLRDITDRTEMIEDLRRNRERYESLFDSIRDAIVVADTDGRIVDCNRAFTDLFGYEPEEIEGELTSVLGGTKAEFERLQDSLGRHVEDPSFVQTLHFEKQTGQEFPGETNVFYLRGVDGDIEGFIGLIRDVTERRARIAQLRTIDRVLRHNLTNDLTVIMGNAEIIATGATGDDPQACAERILRTGEKLRRTAEKEREITTFLAQSRPAVERDAVDVLERVVDDFRDRYPASDLVFDAPDEQPILAVAALDRAIEELLENATVHSDRETPSITVSIERIDDVVEISVADDGPRIPEIERQVLSGEQDVEPLYHGRGIGLWLVQLIVQYSDGTVRVDENDPRGNVVTIRLPTPSEGPT